MLKIGLAGLGRMGSFHLSIYEKLMEDGFPVKLVAICDVDEDKLTGKSSAVVNLTEGKDTKKSDLTKYHQYTNIDDMLAKEDLDYVDVVVPTYLHCELSCKVLESGRHCFCEKPMALNEEQCQKMIDTADKAGKQLIVGHCLRYWPEYVYLKQIVENKVYGEVNGGYFWRGGYQDHETNGSWQNWIITREKGGGALCDQHVHDTDVINWIFGMPKGVSTIGKTTFPGSAYDLLSTNYIYDDRKTITAIDDTAYKGVPFTYGYKVDLEWACIEYKDFKLTVYPHKAAPFSPDVSIYGPSLDAYYNELSAYLTAVDNGFKLDRMDPYKSKEAIKIMRTEMRSADNNGTLELI